jgi:GNAT superfamily N-acetyltransferase
MHGIVIKPFVAGQEDSVSQLVKEVYDEFVAPGYTPEGNAFFYAYIEHATMLLRQRITNNILLAYLGKALAGMIEMRDNERVSLLFTRKEFMGQGVARMLLGNAILLCKTRDKSLTTISVHASPYSIPAYQHLGFIATAPLQEDHGILYLPMEMQLQ